MKNGGGGGFTVGIWEKDEEPPFKKTTNTLQASRTYSASTSQQTVTSQTRPPTCPLHPSLPPAVFFLGQYSDHARS
ncbi:hypothetical protein BDZ89DRAFT_684648 [Hymenopellis radicata]|nr:hypothetical protein BDZ89DRAFT_684648 [Hymenopellis radicata]